MKLTAMFLLVSLVSAVGLTYSPPAHATVTLTCEQGAPGSWKFCEVAPEGYPTYIWSVSGGGVLDPYVCTSTSTACTAFCMRGSRTGFLHVSIYNSSNQLIGSATRGLGCVSGS